ncbi:MAG TPA: hypothetical protein VFD32_17765, partial [Dehalococcoidia bacterium]|nr:hypothetical protein [Dehalococcoidia bacterium]
MLYLIAFIILGCVLAAVIGWAAERRRRDQTVQTLVDSGSDLSEQGPPQRGLRRWFGRQPALMIPPGVCAALIPAHNEEAVIAATLRSAVKVWHKQ